LDGDGIGHWVEHHRRRPDRNAVLLRRRLRIIIGGDGRLAFFGNGPIPRAAEKSIELGAWREPGPSNTGSGLIAAGVNAA
jgi:hypothetical protein